MQGSVLTHPREADRLESLRSYGVLDTPPSPDYDGLVGLAARLCRVPIALVSLVEDTRQWFKAKVGLDVVQTPIETSFCRHSVAAAAPLVVADALADVRFRANPLVLGDPRIRAYAGVPLIGRDGLPLGTVCAIDREPRPFTPDQLADLATIGRQVVALLELGRADLARGRPPADATGVQAVRGPLATDPITLRSALDAGELVPHFQPIVDLRRGSAVGFEALLRWEHPELGVQGPGSILPAIESSGLIYPVGRHVLRESIDLVAQLRRTARRHLGVSVNVSLAQLAQTGFSEAVLLELRRAGVPPRTLSLELTETVALADDRSALQELHSLRSAGVKLSIDDYGTGYSSLMRVLDLPVNTLKLERALVSRLPHDHRAFAAVRSTIDMARALGIAVVAEGIEQPGQRAALVDLGCRFGQGFLFGSATPAARLLGTPGRAVHLGVPRPRSAGVTAPP